VNVAGGAAGSVAGSSVACLLETTDSVVGRAAKGAAGSVAWTEIFTGAGCPAEQAGSKNIITKTNKLLVFMILFTFSLNCLGDCIR
jgi:hypothetical protein